MRLYYNWKLPELYQVFPKMDTWYNIEEIQDNRTTAQNRILWGYYYKEAVQAFSLKGIILSVDQFHFFAKTLIPKKKKKCKITGKYRTEERSTTKLGKKEFNKYIESIRIWIWENMQYSIQEPTDEQELLYYQNNICN